MSYNKFFPASETTVRNLYCLFLYASFFLCQIIQVRRLNLNLRSSYLKNFKSSLLSHTLWVTLYFCDIASSLFKTVPSDFAVIFFNLNKVSILESSREIKFQEFKTYSELKTLEWDILNHDYLIWVSNIHTFDFLLKPFFIRYCREKSKTGFSKLESPSHFCI